VMGDVVQTNLRSCNVLWSTWCVRNAVRDKMKCKTCFEIKRRDRGKVDWWYKVGNTISED
jgi:hypothetical protein